jgi:hypothetical protein
MIVLGPRKFWGPCVNREKRPHQRTQRAHPHQFGLAAGPAQLDFTVGGNMSDSRRSG